MNESSTSILLPELSRSYKSRRYNENWKGPKRKRPSQVCFEIKSSPEKRGIGMFASQEIACGSLIIAHEDPIIAVATGMHHQTTRQHCQHSNAFCFHCHAPLGSLREDHLQATGISLELPCLVESSKSKQSGPIFTNLKEGGIGSLSMKRLCIRCRCCSETCASRGRICHSFLCPYNKRSTIQALEKFYLQLEEQGTIPSTIFRLAASSVLVIFSTVLTFNDSQMKHKIDHLEDESVYWWRDYNSHPIWWNIIDDESNNNIQRKEKTQEFCGVLKSVLSASIHCNPLVVPTGPCTTLLESILQRVCVVEIMGEILGMLQCNVMEFQYPSPVQQYMEHVHDYHSNNGDDTSHVPTGLAWLSENVHLPDGDNDKAKEHDEKPFLCSATPMIGSGLYPLLTLANHDCDPNASIDFLQESNRGSMVALRDIQAGEEICITYVPNGDWDSSCYGAENPSDRFRYLKPTRTWKWFNKSCSKLKEEENEDLEDNEGQDNEEEGCQNDRSSIEEGEDDGYSEVSSPSNNMTNEHIEGSNQSDRARALLEYGFSCGCARCRHEKANPLIFQSNGGQRDVL